MMLEFQARVQPWAHGVSMQGCGEDELARIWNCVEKIRIKQVAKPKPISI